MIHGAGAAYGGNENPKARRCPMHSRERNQRHRRIPPVVLQAHNPIPLQGTPEPLCGMIEQSPTPRGAQSGGRCMNERGVPMTTITH